MTDPAALAAIDQLIAASRDASDFLRAGPGSAEVWPDTGPITGPTVDAMLLAIGAAHTDGEGVICEHLNGIVDWAIWFPWSHWLCPTCAMAALEDRMEDTDIPIACDACGADLASPGQPAVVHRWKIAIAPQSAVITRPDGTPATRFTPPLVVVLLLCQGCGQRNKRGRPNTEGGQHQPGEDHVDQGDSTDPGPAARGSTD